jgi:hypothetical protein
MELFLKYSPILSIILNIVYAFCWILRGDIVGCFYWLFAAGLTVCVILMR